MFAGRKSKNSGSSNEAAAAAAASRGTSEHELTTSKEQAKLLNTSKTKQLPSGGQFDGYDERESFLNKHKSTLGRAKLAKQETLDEQQQQRQQLKVAPDGCCRPGASCWCCGCSCSCLTMLLRVLKKKWVLVPVFIICCIAAIYCIPFIEIEARTPQSLPHIPFNYREGPLRPSTASQFKIERLFANQISGPESVALDSQGNMYMAIEGGFILWAHLNKSSLPKRSFYIAGGDSSSGLNLAPNQRHFDVLSPEYTELVKIAELNGIKQINPAGSGSQQRRAAAAFDEQQAAPRGGGEQQQQQLRIGGSWRRECLLDEQYYGHSLYTDASTQLPSLNNNQVDNEIPTRAQKTSKKFTSNVVLSRCSKPLGVRLSPDEGSLYVVDTLSGLYRVNLRTAERPNSSQRLVSRLIDFRADNRHQLLPMVALDDSSTVTELFSPLKQEQHLKISLMAIDDLAIDYGAGTRGGDMIYLTDASQKWRAISFVFDMLEGRPSGAILRYDTGINQLSVLSPSRVAHVRTSVLEFDENQNSLLSRAAANLSTAASSEGDERPAGDIYLGLGAPRLDENDVFDDRPLSFPNGIELTDDKQAILIADTANKRIIKHYIKGSRRGTSDLWAWTPHFPDNIRRGYDKNHETYWVVGCGEDTTNKIDFLAWLQSWPRVRKYMLKNIYAFGWFIELIGGNLLQSNRIRDFGYSLKIGNSLCESFCSGMMILQYNKYGDVIRSIYSKEFPNDISLYSQVNEVIDAKNQEHLLYLSSPTYKYVTKLVLPSDSFDVPPSSSSSSFQ